MRKAPPFLANISESVVTVLALILTPIIIIGGLVGGAFYWLTFYIYRVLITCIAKCIMPSARIMCMYNHYFALGEEYTSTQYYITFQVILEGHVTLEKVSEGWTELVMNKLNPSGQLQFPELRDYLHTFCGYSFRRRMTNFDVKNYIHVHKEETGNGIVDKAKLVQIRKKFQAQHFQKGHPLWEILVVNNYRHNNSKEDCECTAFIFKNHHALADGTAIASLFYSLAGISVDRSKVEKKARKFKWRTLVTFLKWPLEIFQVIFKWTFNTIWNPKRSYDTHAWHLAEFKMPLKYETWLTEPINKNIFRQIKSVYNISTMSVVLCVVSGGMQRMMRAKGLAVPRDIRVEFPVVLPNHPGTLTNHASIIFARLPFSNADCKEKLLVTDCIIKKAGVGLWPVVVRYSVKYMQVLPTWVKRIAATEVLTSVIFSCVNFPIAVEKIFGHKCLSHSIIAHLNRTNAGCQIGIIGSGDYFHMTLQLDSKLLNHPEEVKDLEKYMLEELNFLRNVCLT